jgi:pimeloyl-ACP methyl ester carboxylesterase
MPKLAINDIELYYEVQGEGIPLLLIAGLASDSQSWQPLIGELTSHCQVITLDNRGVGRTSPLDAETSIHMMATDCIALVKHLGLKSVNMLGHSMGGFVAQECAIHYPEYLDKLILAATSSYNPRRNNDLFSNWAWSLEAGLDLKIWVRSIFYWVLSERFFDDEQAIEDAVQFEVDYPYPPNAVAFRKQVDAIVEFNCTDKLSTIAARTLVIGGNEDLLFPVQMCKDLAERIPDAVLTVLNNTAHSIYLDNPHVFIKTVLNFLLKTAKTCTPLATE